jgi:hypothetical protein
MIFGLPGFSDKVKVILNEPIKDTSDKDVAWRWGMQYTTQVDGFIITNHPSNV